MNLNSARQSVLDILQLKQHTRDTPLPETDKTANTPVIESKSKTKIERCHKRAEYRIVEGPNGIAELELRVNDMLDQGWKLIGGICFDRGCAYQAMARITSDPMEPTVPPPTLL